MQTPLPSAENILKVVVGDGEFDGVDVISIVARPAIESGFVAFSQDATGADLDKVDYYIRKAADGNHHITVAPKRTVFKQAAPDKQILVGPALIPNKLIYRNIEGEDKWVFFDQDSINKIVAKWKSKPELKREVNFDHQSGYKVNAVIEDSVISEGGFVKAFAIDAPAGTWLVAMSVIDPYFWDTYVKSGVVTGFSVEAMISYVPFQKSQAAVDKALETQPEQAAAKKPTEAELRAFYSEAKRLRVEMGLRSKIADLIAFEEFNEFLRRLGKLETDATFEKVYGSKLRSKDKEAAFNFWKGNRAAIEKSLSKLESK